MNALADRFGFFCSYIALCDSYDLISLLFGRIAFGFYTAV
jgi:hypothetical protein